MLFEPLLCELFINIINAIKLAMLTEQGKRLLFTDRRHTEAFPLMSAIEG